jgi:type IV secretory pathway TraG/TraD family ATPase VirD4
MNGFRTVELKKQALKKLIYNFSFRNFNSAQKNILNIEELTSIYHFPTRYIETPYIKAAKSGVAAPPAELPEKGLVLLGKVAFRGEEKEIYFTSKNDRRRHFYIVGQTGTGKTTLLREMIRQDIEAGEGVGVIDPHGDLIEDTLANIPKERVEDVILFEPFDLARPIGLNMLEYDTPEQKDFAAQEMIAIFHKLFPPEIIGPMFEHYMRNAMLALMADKENPGTLVEIPRMFTDPEFLEDRLKKVTDPIVRNFWLKEWKQTTGETKSDMLGYVVSKVGRFIENEMMRNIIGQSHSGFDLGQIMDEKKIFLANLSKGQTGEVNSSLLGLILVSKIQMAAMKRARISEEQRKDFYLYVDEFQNFTTDSIATILSEARKYRLNLILSHQYIPQLTPEIRNAVLGNVGSISAFRIGADDAEFLEKQFEPEFSRFDLVNLDNFELIVKIMIEDKITSPFKLKTNPPQKGNPEIVEPIKKIAKLKYGKTKEIVEQEILKRSQLTTI